MSEWSPYALERYRVGETRGRNRWLLAALAILILGWLAMNFIGGNSSFTVGTGGQEGSVLLDRPEDPGPPKATVTVSPGRVTELDQPVQGGQAPSSRELVTSDSPYPILKWLLLFGPLALLPWLARRLLVGRGRELNFGVYKGAMPLEMISATQRDLLFSRKAVESPLFGKERGDYVQDER